MARHPVNAEVQTKLYVVENAKGEERLIRARTRPQALAHAAKSEFATRLASQDDLIALIGRGIKPEFAVAEAAE